jgi:hypothetical protein
VHALLIFVALSACAPAAPSFDDAADRPARDTDPPGDTDDTDVVDTDTGVEVIPGDTSPPPAPDPSVLPVLRIDAERRITDTEKTDALMEVIEAHDGTFADLDAAPVAYATRIGIEIHGSSSIYYPKLGYKFECRNGAGDDEDCALAGLPEGSDWVLHAPYSDKSYMRNALAFGIGGDVGEAAGRWEPRTRFVEVILDGEYVGVYLLIERISRESDRLDIPKTTLDDGSVAGGFIVKADGHRSAGFDTAIGTQIDWVSPKADSVTPAEAAYLLSWFDQMETVLAGPDFADPTVGYAAWIDVDAWVDHWLVNELTHNIDAYRLSAYLWTDGPPGASLLRAGPLWDFDRAWGNCNYCGTWSTAGWIYDDLAACGYPDVFPMWWERLREDPAFQQRLRARWEELRLDTLSNASLRERIATFRAALARAEVRDQERWGTMGVFVDPNYYVGATWDEELAWLEAWAVERAEWMDIHVGT